MPPLDGLLELAYATDLDLARKGYELIQKEMPEYEVEGCEINQAWVLLEMKPLTGRNVKLAIWRHTGNVYRMQPDFSVEEDPWLVVTKL
jgi:hypothetical protein